MSFILGCQHRAYLFAKHLTQYANDNFPHHPARSFEPPMKHFLFGNFQFDSENARDEQYGIHWSYHVAPAIKIRNSNSQIRHNPTLWILDPALSPKPLSKTEYHQKFREFGRITGYVTCGANTYGSGDKCIDAMDNEDPNKPFGMSYFDGELLNE